MGKCVEDRVRVGIGCGIVGSGVGQKKRRKIEEMILNDKNIYKQYLFDKIFKEN